MRHRANCRRRTTNAAVTVTVTVKINRKTTGICQAQFVPENNATRLLQLSDMLRHTKCDLTVYYG